MDSSALRKEPLSQSKSGELKPVWDGVGDAAFILSVGQTPMQNDGRDCGCPKTAVLASTTPTTVPVQVANRTLVLSTYSCVFKMVSTMFQEPC